MEKSDSKDGRSALACWIEAMRLRTLPVSVSGVVLAIGIALAEGRFSAIPAVLCFVFAVLAQIASNFANEYYDYRDGLDAPGREGPRRGVTEGDLSPEAMLRATYLTLGVACCVGLGLVAYGGWWLVIAGLIIAVGAIAYSAGPFPLSRHGLGEVAVIAFFGVIPVTLTCYVQSLEITRVYIVSGLTAGLMGANVLIINNYRDADDDMSVGKRTLAVVFGRKIIRFFYLLNGLTAVALMMPQWLSLPGWAMVVPVVYLAGLLAVWLQMPHRIGHALTPMLAATSMLMLLYCSGYAIAVCMAQNC